MPHSKIKETTYTEENSAVHSGLDTCHGAGAIKRRVSISLFNHQRFMCCLCPSGCGMSFPTHVVLLFVGFCAVRGAVGSLDA